MPPLSLLAYKLDAKLSLVASSECIQFARVSKSKSVCIPVNGVSKAHLYHFLVDSLQRGNQLRCQNVIVSILLKNDKRQYHTSQLTSQRSIVYHGLYEPKLENMIMPLYLDFSFEDSFVLGTDHTSKF